MSAARARGAGPAAVALLTPGSEGGRPAAKLVVKALGTLTSGVTPAARFLLREKGQPRHLREHATSGLRHGRVQRWAGPPDAAAPGRPDLLPPRVLGCRSSARVQAASPRQVCRWRQLSSPLHTWRRVRVRVPACPARGAAGETKPSRHPPPPRPWSGGSHLAPGDRSGRLSLSREAPSGQEGSCCLSSNRMASMCLRAPAHDAGPGGRRAHGWTNVRGQGKAVLIGSGLVYWGGGFREHKWGATEGQRCSENPGPSGAWGGRPGAAGPPRR